MRQGTLQVWSGAGSDMLDGIFIVVLGSRLYEAAQTRKAEVMSSRVSGPHTCRRACKDPSFARPTILSTYLRMAIALTCPTAAEVKLVIRARQQVWDARLSATADMAGQDGLQLWS